MSTQAMIQALYIYPIKSCQGISVETLELSQTGPLYDRNWMITDENGQFLTQRTHEHLAKIKTKQKKQKNKTALRKFLKKKVILVRYGAQSKRTKKDFELRFSDASPVLVINQASLQYLCSKAGVDIPANRGRAGGGGGSGAA